MTYIIDRSDMSSFENAIQEIDKIYADIQIQKVKMLQDIKSKTPDKLFSVICTLYDLGLIGKFHIFNIGNY